MSREVSITIIDDDEIAHYLVTVFLRRELPSATIHSFLSAMEFLAALKDGNFKTDGILLDISMPKMTGWDLADKLKTTDFNTPVHILSSSADSRDLQRAENYSFVKRYIVKPLTVETLRKFLADVVSIKS
jgi:CheY-like chemotaxis protein